MPMLIDNTDAIVRALHDVRALGEQVETERWEWRQTRLDAVRAAVDAGLSQSRIARELGLSIPRARVLVLEAEATR